MLNDVDAANEIMKRLKTSEDCVSFFAHEGSHTAVKFVYLNKADTGNRFRPYDLVVVPPEKVHPRHYVMSEKGITKVVPNKPSEVMPLVQFMREATVFNVVCQIRFFKNYLLRKTLDMWKHSIRFKLYSRQRSRLAHKLFLAKPAFCDTLLQVAGTISSAHSVSARFSEHQSL